LVIFDTNKMVVTYLKNEPSSTLLLPMVSYTFTRMSLIQFEWYLQDSK